MTSRTADGGRFEHLLKPVKDLTEEWGIECAAELKDYLEELQDLTIAFEGEERREVDFAEAALIIQNSTKVYGKRVEGLSQLVLSALSTLKKKAAERFQQRTASLGDEVDLFGDEEQLLVLDLDAIVEGRKIDMVDDLDTDTAAEGMELLRRRTFDAAAVALMVDDVESLALQGTSVHESGMIEVDDGLDVRAVSMDLEADGGGGGFGASAHVVHDGVADMSDSPDGTDASADLANDKSADSATDESAHDDYSDSYEPADYGDEHGNAISKEEEEEEEEEEEADPWAGLDPHDADDADERVPAPRPFRKGKTWSKPRADAAPSSALADPVLVGLAQDHCSSSSSSSGGGGGGAEHGEESASWWAPPDGASLTAAHFASGGVGSAEFTLMGARFVAEERSAQRKAAAARRQLQRQQAASQAASASQRHRAIGTSQATEDSDTEGFDTYDSYDGGDEPWVEQDSESESGDVHPLLLDVAPEPLISASCSYEGLASKMLEKMKREAEAYAIETDITRRVSEWQDRLQPVLDEQHARHEFDIESYSSGILTSLSSGTESDTKAAKRKGVPSAEEGLSFENVLSGAVAANADGAAQEAGAVAPYEVARLFLSTLFLTDKRNVDINVAACDGEGTAEAFQVVLLREQQMDVSNFRAPSLTAAQ